MSIIRFIADLHLGHKGMAEYRGFDSIEQHDNYVIKQWNSVVNKHDVTYILGDVTMEKKKSYPLLDKLNGKKYVVLGNHDRRQDVTELLKYVQGVAGMVQYKGMFLTHCPVHPMEFDYRVYLNIHGHIHKKTVKRFFGLLPDKRYVGVSCEQVDFIPQTVDQIKSRYKLGVLKR